MRKIVNVLLILAAFGTIGHSQVAPFELSIEPLNINGLGGLQAYAWGQHNGKWLVIGGRLDGLHRRQPFAAFDIAGHNTQLMVIDPIAQQMWAAPLSSLPVSMAEQLSSTNMEFHQEGDFLYVIGGYGYSATALDHVTYPNLTAVNVPEVINAVVNGSPFDNYFRQWNGPEFAVTGGYLNKIYDVFYLTGGHRFDGRYNPMGNPTYTQTYTNESKKFQINDDGVNLSITYLPSIVDAVNLHRRDYNVAPQIMPNGEEGLTAFSGVFQVGVDLPFLNSVDIDSSGYAVNNSFSQYYNHYHCAHIPLYSNLYNEMHTVFFGGIAQYYDDQGTLVQDNNVPFVNTIARVTRDAAGNMAEYKLPIEMPGYLGAGSEFIPVDTLPSFGNGVFRLDDFAEDTTLLGYVYGGINSTAANIFFTNTGTQSSASSTIFKVYLIKNLALGTHQLNPQSIGTLQMQVSPNPNDGNFIVKYHLAKSCTVVVSVSNAQGNLLEKTVFENLAEGEQLFHKKIEGLTDGGVYFIALETPYEKATQKVIVAK